MVQKAANKNLGRPKDADVESLRYWEHIWLERLVGLRDGAPEMDVKVQGGEGGALLLKSVGAGGRSLRIRQHGQEDRVIRIGATAERHEIQDWSDQMEEAQREFIALESGKKVATVRYCAIAPEPNIFLSLLWAETPAQVRRACKRSKYWLRFRFDFPKGGFFQDPSPCPRVLYEYAEKFCKAKLDPRYPRRDTRESGDYKRIKYLARVMAGLSLPKPIEPSYAVEILRKLKVTKSASQH